MNRIVMPVVLALIVALALVAGCAPEGARDVTPTEQAGPTATTERPTPTPEDTPASTDGIGAPPDVPADAEAAVAWAVADLASRLAVREDAVTLASIEAVDWSDSSLGCPQPGYMYLQVITPGYRIVLAADDATYAYHAAQGAENAVYCAE